MKRPENFNKINSKTFTTKKGNTYKFSEDTNHSPILWVFAKPDTTTYSLAFVIDWENQSYEIKRAESGNGKNWKDVLHVGYFEKEKMTTMQSFIDWAHWRVNEFEYYYNNK